jgi:hypothetical protein
VTSTGSRLFVSDQPARRADRLPRDPSTRRRYERSPGVRAPHEIEVRVGCVGYVGVSNGCRVADEGVEATEAFLCFVKEISQLVGVGDVRADAQQRSEQAERLAEQWSSGAPSEHPRRASRHERVCHDQIQAVLS